jgi:hypothetical protein
MDTDRRITKFAISTFVTHPWWGVEILYFLRNLTSIRGLYPILLVQSLPTTVSMLRIELRDCIYTSPKFSNKLELPAFLLL